MENSSGGRGSQRGHQILTTHATTRAEPWAFWRPPRRPTLSLEPRGPLYWVWGVGVVGVLQAHTVHRPRPNR